MNTRSVFLALLAGSAFLASSAGAATVLGMNFCDYWPNPQVSDGTADGLATWTDSWLVPEGNFYDNGTNASIIGSTTVKLTWASANGWAAGNEDNNEQALYREYLDDGNLGDGVGVRVTITGLSAWMATEGLQSYGIRGYASTDTDNATFRDITVRSGSLITGSVLDTISVPVLGDNDYPTGAFDTNWDSRGHGDSINTLTADTITLTILPRDGDTRGTLAALKITGVPVPEASSASLLALAGLGLVRRRRA